MLSKLHAFYCQCCVRDHLQDNEYYPEYVDMILGAYLLKENTQLAPSLPQGWRWESLDIALPSNASLSSFIGNFSQVLSDITKLEVYACYNALQNRLVIIIPGTHNNHDLIKDVLLLFQGSHSSGLTKRIGEAIRKKVKEMNRRGMVVELTGHSLGGSIAAQVAETFDYPAQVFEAPGTSAQAVVERDNIKNFLMVGPNPITSLHNFPGRIYVVSHPYVNTTLLNGIMSVEELWGLHAMTGFKCLEPVISARMIHYCHREQWEQLRAPIKTLTEQQIYAPVKKLAMFQDQVGRLFQGWSPNMKFFNATVNSFLHVMNGVDHIRRLYVNLSFAWKSGISESISWWRETARSEKVELREEKAPDQKMAF